MSISVFYFLVFLFLHVLFELVPCGRLTGNETSTLSFPGTNARCVVVSFPGTKVHGNETSIIRNFGMQNLRPLNIMFIFQRPSCGSPIAVSSGFIAGTAPVCVKGKKKFSHTRYRALGPELIPVYRQSARRWREVNHAIDLAVGCRYFLSGLRLPP